MAFTYNNVSVVESFDLQAMIGEGIEIYVYGAAWDGSNWLSDPTTALTAVHDAFDSIPNLDFSGIQILSTYNSIGTGMAFAVADSVYNGRTYLDPTDSNTLRIAIMNALNTGETGIHLVYGDVVLGSSKSGET